MTKTQKTKEKMERYFIGKQHSSPLRSPITSVMAQHVPLAHLFFLSIP